MKDLENLEYFKVSGRFGGTGLTFDLQDDGEDGNTMTDLERVMQSLG